MNVNLADESGRALATGEIDNHVISMATAGFPVTGAHMLRPEGRNWPGAYQVWLQIRSKDTDATGWIYVNPEGVVVYRDFPGAEVKFTS
jgi:hypothetical protein